MASESRKINAEPHTWPHIATSSPCATENLGVWSVGPLCFASKLLLEPTELAMLLAEAVGSLSLHDRTQEVTAMPHSA